MLNEIVKALQLLLQLNMHLSPEVGKVSAELAAAQKQHQAELVEPDPKLKAS